MRPSIHHSIIAVSVVSVRVTINLGNKNSGVLHTTGGMLNIAVINLDGTVYQMQFLTNVN